METAGGDLTDTDHPAPELPLRHRSTALPSDREPETGEKMSSLTTSGQPIRSTLRTTGVLGLALGLTSGVLVLVANVVDTWA